MFRKNHSSQINSSMSLYLKSCNNSFPSMEIKIPVYSLPRIGETLQYNGVRYLVKDVVHHYNTNFTAYIDLVCEEISLA